MDLSVVVSTYNRVEDLERFLDSLRNTVVPTGCDWELILVDNNSSDGTEALARDYALAAPFPVVYLFEPQQGKSHGVNTGIARARGHIIAFTDDDVVVSPKWISTIIDYFDRHQAVGCVGGMVQLYDPMDAPVSVRLSKDPEKFDRSNFSARKIPLMGCNLAVRAEVMRSVGDFDPNLGPGCSVGVAEDLDILYRIIRAGYQLHYCPDMLVYHNHGRRTAEHLLAPEGRVPHGPGCLLL